jgi:hypothetical protein
MLGIIDARVRVEENKLGKFTMDLAKHIPYATLVGVEIIVPSDNKNEQKRSPQMKRKKWPWKSRKAEFSPQQQAVLEAIKTGHKDLNSISEVAGFKNLRSTSRVINGLKRKEHIKVVGGTYVTTLSERAKADEK